MEPSDGKPESICRLALMPSGRQGKVQRGSNLLKAAQDLGVEIESICGGRQTCMKCQVIVEEGQFPKPGILSNQSHLSPPTDRELDFFDDKQLKEGRRLACAGEVLGDLLIAVPEESQARKQIIAKAATDRVIEVLPAVRQVYVEFTAPGLDAVGGDWERLQSALEKDWGLTELSCDFFVTRTLSEVLRKGDFKVTVSVWQDKEVLRVQPGYQEGFYGLAIDVGSTTVVAHLCDLRTGEVLATEATMNPQVRYGEDLMSRVSYAMTEPQGLYRLNRGIIRTLNELAEKTAERVGIPGSDILDVVIVGNTVMHHILLGINPKELGVAPFAPSVSSSLDLKARDIGLNLNQAARVHVLPLVAGHIGADNVAVLLAEAPQDQDEIVLVVDVGTNAEIDLGNRQSVLVASSPTGPAFEGAQITHGQRAAPGAIERVRIDRTTLDPSVKIIGSPKWILPIKDEELLTDHKVTGICGSGIIEAIAEMYLAGIILSDGSFDKAMSVRNARIRFQNRTGEYVLVDPENTVSGLPIVITQNDVRAIQLAKAALYAGTKLLMKHRSVDKVDRIILAGAFGSYINPFHAMVLGLIPNCDLEKVVAVGNAAGDGARIALLNRDSRIIAARLAQWVEHISTPLEASFQDEFVAALSLPHAKDPFLVLTEVLPHENNGANRSKRSRIRDRSNSIQ
jgi:uncharacterized 2Fe-2S/4Fe-4S cluster protein (DUF4445 family)